VKKRLAVAGSGAIACGLAATAAHHVPVFLLARSESSADRARETVEKTLARLGAEVDPDHVEIVTEPQAIAEATFVVEAVVEDYDIKARLLGELNEVIGPEAILASTTSSLSVELIFPKAASEDTRARALKLCETFEKTPVVVPDVPGFVVNRLLFPYLFNAVRLMEETGMDPADIDTCMKLGAGHPMGPLSLLDLVGLDVSAAIGETIGEPVPDRVQALVAEGALGRKTGRGLHSYERS
jgi:3-hydroxybutyryl-CoA dehydrogenase